MWRKPGMWGSPLGSDPNAFNSRFSKKQSVCLRQPQTWGVPSPPCCFSQGDSLFHLANSELPGIPPENTWGCSALFTLHLNGPELFGQASTSASGSHWHAGHRRDFSCSSVGNSFLCRCVDWNQMSKQDFALFFLVGKSNCCWML